MVIKTPETFHFRRQILDTVSVQKKHNYVNDDEKHEENPHLEDFLVPHHTVHVEPDNLPKPTLSRPCPSIMHKADCPSRHSCKVTESKMHITFDKVIVRDYGMVLGDHPSCSYGPPVQLEWDYLEYEPLPVDEYEYHHSRRRTMRQLILNYYKRTEMLSADNSRAELKQATQEVAKVQWQRAVTRQVLPLYWVQDAIESVGRKFKRGFKKEKPDYTWNTKDDVVRSRCARRPSIIKFE
jgi:hypothetical protein